jgi:hypothetical protein
MHEIESASAIQRYEKYMYRRYRLLIALSLLLLTSASPTAPAAADADPILVGAGDIANCGSGGPSASGAEATATLLDGIAGTVFTAGDNAYNSGTEAEFRDCYGPTWGRHKARTRPTAGNHEYITPGATSYYAYFGANAGAAGVGYYSYDLGAWHIVALNSNIDAGADSAQALWLAADLSAHRTACTLAYWHHPVFSSGNHGNDPYMQEIWRILYAFGADVALTGHDHNYERFALQTADGIADSAHGIREFVVGTGGTSLRSVGSLKPNSEVRDSETLGVLKLTLRPTSYDWEFVPIAGETFTDTGSAPCVEAAPGLRFWNYLPVAGR